MKTSGQYFKVGDIFFDSELGIKAKCIDGMNGYHSCEECVYDFKNSCTDDNTPFCLPTKRKDNTDVIFIKVENDDSLRIKKAERL